MIRTHVFACAIPKAEADDLNRESGRVYTNTLVRHYRIYRKTGHWLSMYAGKRVEDGVGDPTTLHAHSRDAAQEGFYKACKTARAVKRVGGHIARHPHKRKWYRTSVWKKAGIRVRDGVLVLARAKGLPAVRAALPAPMAALSASVFSEVRLVWDKAARHYLWHVVVDDGGGPTPTTATGVAGVQRGFTHPAALTDGTSAAVVSCRALRSTVQYTNKRLLALRSKQDHLIKGSSRWKRLQRRKNRFLAQQKRRERDLLHKASRAVIGWAQENSVGTLAIGDVRDVADGKRLKRTEQQKVSQWSHGTMRRYIGYKAEAVGIVVDDTVDEAYTTKTCPSCGTRAKPRGRVYTCRACGFRGVRDIVGAANILSLYRYGEVGRVTPPVHAKYLRPFVRMAGEKRSSRLDTSELARCQGLRAETSLATVGREAAPL